MRRLLLSILLVVLMVSMSMASEESAGSGELSSSQLVYTGRGAITQVWIHTDGVNDATVTLYDSLSAAGTKITPSIVCPAGSIQCAGDWPIPRSVSTGIYLSLSGTGATAIVEYVPR